LGEVAAGASRAAGGGGSDHENLPQSRNTPQILIQVRSHPQPRQSRGAVGLVPRGSFIAGGTDGV